MTLKANITAEEFDDLPGTISAHYVASGDGYRLDLENSDPDKSGGDGKNDDSIDEKLGIAKDLYSELTERKRKVRIRAELAPMIAEVESIQLQSDIEKIALNHFTLDDDGKVVPKEKGDGNLKWFVQDRIKGVVVAPMSGGGGARGQGGLSSHQAAMMSSGKGNLTQLAQAARRNRGVMANVMKLLRNNR